VIPEGIGRLTALDLLDLSGNMISVVPAVLDTLVQLRSLNLRNNRLAKLEATFTPLKKLTRLSLQENRLSEIPKGVRELVHLKELLWYANSLCRVPEAARQMEITALNLSNNQLSELDVNAVSESPPAFAGSLRRLIAEDNQIQAIAPSSLRPLVRCNLLRLNRNCLTRIPSDIRFMLNLETVELIQNQLTGAACAEAMGMQGPGIWSSVLGAE
jgi:Leucine-rich repeat (LRR) protein